MRKHLATLGLHTGATAEEIRLAYRRLCKMYHPDLHGGDPYYEERLKAINAAYQALKGGEPEQDNLFQRSRRAYDRWVSPDFSKKKKAPPQQAPREGGRPGTNGRRSGFRGFFTLLLVVAVVLMPFWLARPDPAYVSSPGSVRNDMVSIATTQGRADMRFQRDLAHFRRIQSHDPALKGLDLETGYYEGGGETIKFSWDFIRYLQNTER